MMHGHNDNYNTQLKSNPLNDAMNQVYINNTSFFPMMEIVNLNFSPDLSGLTGEFDIFDTGTSSFNMKKMSEYFEINIAIRERNAKWSRYLNVDFRLCKASDFVKRGVPIQEGKTKEQYEQRLCPNFEKYPELVRIKNIYDNKEDRVSFSMEIYRCKNTKSKRC